MTVEVFLLAATTCIAAVAVVAAGRALRAVRELKSLHSAHHDGQTTLHAVQAGHTNAEITAFDDAPNAVSFVPAEVARPLELEPKVVRGRVIVPPTQAQVVRTALGRPGVRVSVLAHGLAHALRAENRDRILALMRREYRHRRRERLSAGRQAVRAARPTSAPSTDRLHDHLLEARPASLTDRMISS